MRGRDRLSPRGAGGAAADRAGGAGQRPQACRCHARARGADRDRRAGCSCGSPTMAVASRPTRSVASGYGLSSMEQRAAHHRRQPDVDSRPAGRHAGCSSRCRWPRKGDDGPMSEPPSRVMLVDDHALVRSAVRQALDRRPTSRSWARPAPPTRRCCWRRSWRRTSCCWTSTFRGPMGLRLLRELAPRLPTTKIVMLTVSDDRRDLVEAVRNGAAGYLTKDLSPEALQRAVRGIRSGDLAMSRAMAADVIQHLATTTNRPRGPPSLAGARHQRPRGGSAGPAGRWARPTARSGAAGHFAAHGRDPRGLAAQQAGRSEPRAGGAPLPGAERRGRRAGRSQELARSPAGSECPMNGGRASAGRPGPAWPMSRSVQPA